MRQAGTRQVQVDALFSVPANGSSLRTSYRIMGSGDVIVEQSFVPGGTDLPELPKFGTQLILPGSFTQIEWFGRGPHENYCDRWTGAALGRYRMPVAEMYHPYIRPQENGTRTDVRWVALTGEDGVGLLAVGHAPAEHQRPALPHRRLRPRRGKGPAAHLPRQAARPGLLNLDWRQMGVGGDNSWGARPHEEYTLEPRPYTYRFRLRPFLPGGRVTGNAGPTGVLTVDTATLQAQFIQLYGESREPLRFFFAPGRINLIGGHTDYTGGLVLPCAIQLGTLAAARRTTANHLALASVDDPFNCTVPLDRPLAPQGKNWVNYPLGVADQFLRRGSSLPGVELLFSGDLPREAGLSSSASLELATGVALNSLACANLEMEELVRMARAAENAFVGLECGIMDQFVSGMGRKGCALLLNCSTLQHRQVPLPLDGHRLVIADTRKPRELAGSGYNERVEECREVELSLLGVLEAPSLSRLTPGRLERNIHRIPTETLRRRARHVVSENGRVMQAVQALMGGDLEAFGALINASHDSLCNDYQVSCPELDCLVEAARGSAGVLGARMMGGGFGGCTLTLVREDAAEEFIARAGEIYHRATGRTAEFHPADTGDGAREIE